jgi:hypothetical protein
MKTLFVKCPECKFLNDLGTKAANTYQSSDMFQLDRYCTQCGILFTETDTGEEDYSIVEVEG